MKKEQRTMEKRTMNRVQVTWVRKQEHGTSDKSKKTMWTKGQPGEYLKQSQCEMAKVNGTRDKRKWNMGKGKIRKGKGQ